MSLDKANTLALLMEKFEKYSQLTLVPPIDSQNYSEDYQRYLRTFEQLTHVMRSIVLVYPSAAGQSENTGITRTCLVDGVVDAGSSDDEACSKGAELLTQGVAKKKRSKRKNKKTKKIFDGVVDGERGRLHQAYVMDEDEELAAVVQENNFDTVSEDSGVDESASVGRRRAKAIRRAKLWADARAGSHLPLVLPRGLCYLPMFRGRAQQFVAASCLYWPTLRDLLLMPADYAIPFFLWKGMRIVNVGSNKYHLTWKRVEGSESLLLVLRELCTRKLFPVNTLGDELAKFSLYDENRSLKFTVDETSVLGGQYVSDSLDLPLSKLMDVRAGYQPCYVASDSREVTSAFIDVMRKFGVKYMRMTVAGTTVVAMPHFVRTYSMRRELQLGDADLTVVSISSYEFNKLPAKDIFRFHNELRSDDGHTDECGGCVGTCGAVNCVGCDGGGGNCC